MQSFPDAPAGLSLQHRIRIFSGDELVLGRGKILLLERIDAHGSIAEAARSMNISYNHAWKLLRVMNRHFKKPLTETARGVSGGASLTEAGKEILNLYKTMEEDCRQVVERHWKTLKARMLSSSK